jgi:23S rRNA (pseudouridine1915-N3)-methyltransferase
MIMTFIRPSKGSILRRVQALALTVTVCLSLCHESFSYNNVNKFAIQARQTVCNSNRTSKNTFKTFRTFGTSFTPKIMTVVPDTVTVTKYKKSQKVSKLSTLRMGLEINIRMVGRKNSIESTSFLQDSYLTYTQRLSSTINLYTSFHKSNEDLIKNVQQDDNKNHGIICLDENGKMYTSEEFSDKLYDWLERYGSRLTFVIGGADGLPPELKQLNYKNNRNTSKSGNDSNGCILNTSNVEFVSLSKMTFTHQWARTILVEQIYRASEIHKGSGYHKS